MIEEEVYIKIPQGFDVHEKKCHDHRLKKVVYDHRKTQWTWYSWINGSWLILILLVSNMNRETYVTEEAAVTGGFALVIERVAKLCFNVKGN